MPAVATLTGYCLSEGQIALKLSFRIEDKLTLKKALDGVIRLEV